MAAQRTLSAANVALAATGGGLSQSVANATIGSAMRPRIPHRHHADSEAPGSRVWVWLHQFELDRQLADGADPAGSPALRARAQLIVGERFRRELVSHLTSVLAKADHPPHWHSASLPVCAGEVRAAREALTELATALQTPAVPAVRGVALAACLINDPEGPLYQRSRSSEIPTLAQGATALLRAGPALAHSTTA